jgi:GT2 family glycosyltransferase
MKFPNVDTFNTNHAGKLRIHVIIATCGRSESVRELVRHLARQTRPADGVLVVGTCAGDVEGVSGIDPNTTVVLASRGLCCQRNAGIDLIREVSDVVIFFDDDFVPANDYIAGVEAMMLADREIVGLTGALVDDGIMHDPIAFTDAVRRLEVDRERPSQTERRPRKALYGCNMVIRLDALAELRFDENLPLYGWMEDVDLTYQLGRRGKLVSGPEITGIHLGVRGGRQPGKRLGYSQIANIIYLYRKGTMQPDIGWRQLLKNLSANLVRSIAPEPHVDRRGRLMGNLLAIGDLICGRLDPRRIISL